MSKNRRVFSDKFKFKVVLEAIKGTRQISEIASEFEIQPNQIINWKKQFLDNGEKVFSTKKNDEVTTLENEKNDLFKKVGEQTVQIDWLKKNIEKWGL